MGTTASRNAPGGVCHPCGQVMINSVNPEKGSKYSPMRLLDFKLEVALVVSRHTNIDCIGGGLGGGGGRGNMTIGRTMTAEEARGRIFGYILQTNGVSATFRGGSAYCLGRSCPRSRTNRR